MDTPIDPKAGIALLEKMSIIEFAIEAAITGDNGPLTSSPNQRRNMALILADVASTFAIIAGRIDPLLDTPEDEKIIRWEAIRAATEGSGYKLEITSTPREADEEQVFTLPPNAFEEAMERAEKELAGSH